VAVAVVVAQVDAAGEVRVAAEVAPGPAPRRGTVGRRHCGAARHGTARILSKRLPPTPLRKRTPPLGCHLRKGAPVGV
jgi:hypothetical protein